MIENFVFIIAVLISNSITISIIRHFVIEHYERVSERRNIYLYSSLIMILVMCFLNIYNLPLLNFAGYIVIAGIYSVILYTNNIKKSLFKFFEISLLILLLMVCESIGVLILKIIIPPYIIQRELLYRGLNLMFSNIVVVFVYYLLISKVWTGKQENISYFIPRQNIVYLVLGIYNVMNIILIISLLPLIKNNREESILLINMACIVIVDVFLLYFLKYSKENEKLKIRLKLLEQQSELEFRFYNDQKAKYNDAKNVLHDVNKHIKVIEELYGLKENQKALDYTKQINTLLEPLLPMEYTDEVILNILLNEKGKQAIMHDIEITFLIKNICLDFMKPIEITTIFGNLLDNAIESCVKYKKEKGNGVFINLKIETFNDMVVVALENSSTNIKWHQNRSFSFKEQHQGIGLMNIEKIINRYSGNVSLKEENDIFYCDLFWCKKELIGDNETK